MPKGGVIITGLEEIDRKLKTLPLRIQKKVLRQSMRAGLKIMADEVRTQAPRDKGLLISGIVVRAVKSRKRGSISLEVRIGSKTEGLVKPSAAGPVFYPAIVEYKHDPFMRRSFDGKGPQVRAFTIASILAGIDAEIKKAP
jgi:hypothetical protein